LATAGGAVWVGSSRQDRERQTADVPAADTTLAVFENTFTPDNISSVRIERRGREVLQIHRESGKWELPGRWPAEEQRLKDLVERLCSLRSRFAPLPVESDADLQQYNLDDPEYVITIVEAGSAKRNYRLELAEGSVAD